MWAAYLIAAVLLAGILGTLMAWALCRTAARADAELVAALNAPRFSATNRDNETANCRCETVALTDALPPLDPVDRESVGWCARCEVPVVRYEDGQTRCVCGDCDLPPALTRVRATADTLASLNALWKLDPREPAHERRSG